MKNYETLISMGSDYVLEARYNWAIRLANTIETWSALPHSHPKEERIYKIGLELYLRLSTLHGMIDASQGFVTKDGIEDMLATLGVTLLKEFDNKG